MKKFGIFVLICVLTCMTTTKAVVVTPQSVQTTKQLAYLPYSQYLKYYVIDEERIKLIFKRLSQDEDKDYQSRLSKEEKQNYKYVKKVQELIDRGAWGEALYKYAEFYPAWVQYYSRCLEIKNYPEAIRTLERLRSMDSHYAIFSEDVINNEFGRVLYLNGDYPQALQYFKMYENTGKPSIYSYMANCYFKMDEYGEAIGYIRKIPNPSYEDNELLYTIYMQKNNTLQAHNIAKVLLNQRYNYNNLMKLQATAQNDSDRLKYAYQARNSTMNENEISQANAIIANIEQRNLERQVSGHGQFIRIPVWNDFLVKLPDNVSIAELCSKQDEFFKTAKEYIKRYQGQQLSNAFLSLNQDFNNYVQEKQNQYYIQKQEELQQALIEKQERDNYIMQQMIEQQRLQRMERLYFLSHPYENMYNPYGSGYWW